MRAARPLAKRKPVSRAPSGVECFPPGRIENADESEGTDDEQRPLQRFGGRCVRAQMIEH